MEHLLQGSKYSIFHNVFKSKQNFTYTLLIFSIMSKNRICYHLLKKPMELRESESINGESHVFWHAYSLVIEGKCRWI